MKVGIIGAGVMGRGVARCTAEHGHDVVLVDNDEGALESARAQIERECRMSLLMTRVAVDVGAVMSRITLTGDIGAVADCDVVVENVPEDWDVKREVHLDLDRICRADALLIANTSAFPITRLASLNRHPERVIGVHFMNPVPMKPAVELIPGRLTGPAELARAEAFLDSIGKDAIHVNDACGFVSNRVLMLTINEAAFLVYEGVANAETVDDVFRRCFGHPMGPLETADLIGVDTILKSVEVLHEHFADPKFRPCPLLKELVAAGYHGRKSGQGFFRYGQPTSAGTATSGAAVAAVRTGEVAS